MQTEDESTNRLSSIFIHYSKVFFILRLTFFVKLSYYTVFVLAFTFSEFSPIHIFHIFTFSTIASYSHFFTTMFTILSFCFYSDFHIFTFLSFTYEIFVIRLYCFLLFHKFTCFHFQSWQFTFSHSNLQFITFSLGCFYSYFRIFTFSQFHIIKVNITLLFLRL